MTQVIAKAHTPEWHEERRKRITASELGVFIGTAPSWYEETRETMVERKLTNTERDSGEKGYRRMAHGRERELSALDLTGKLFGFPTVPYQVLITHHRWPYIAATLDGFLMPYLGTEPMVELTSVKDRMWEIRGFLEGIETPVLTEIKVTDSGHRYKDKSGPYAGQKAWIDYRPDYHFAQVQTGLHLAGLEIGLLSGCLGGDDLCPWLVMRDETWADVLDKVNEDAKQELGALWK